MGWARLAAGLLVTIGLGLSATGAGAVENDPLPVPKGGPRERAVMAYNAGVKLLLDKKYAEAQRKFEEALAADEQLAESWLRRTCAAPETRSRTGDQAGADHRP